MDVVKVTGKGQMTIPKKVRSALGIRAGDLLRVETKNGRVTLSRLPDAESCDLAALEGTLEEWLSDADEDAYGDL